MRAALTSAERGAVARRRGGCAGFLSRRNRGPVGGRESADSPGQGRPIPTAPASARRRQLWLFDLLASPRAAAPSPRCLRGRHRLPEERRSHAKQFFVTGDQIAVFVQIADDDVGGFPHFRASGMIPTAMPDDRSDCSVWKESSRTTAAQYLPSPASCDSRDRDIPGKRIQNQFPRRDLSSLRRDVVSSGGPVAIFLAASDFIQNGNRIFQLLQNGIFHHLSRDHVRSSSLLSASTLTICTKPGVRIWRCETFRFSLGWSKTIKS